MKITEKIQLSEKFISNYLLNYNIENYNLIISGKDFFLKFDIFIYRVTIEKSKSEEGFIVTMLRHSSKDATSFVKKDVIEILNEIKLVLIFGI